MVFLCNKQYFDTVTKVWKVWNDKHRITVSMQLPDENLYMHWYIFVCLIYSIFIAPLRLNWCKV